jgi:beta-galactosidase
LKRCRNSRKHRKHISRRLCSRNDHKICPMKNSFLMILLSAFFWNCSSHIEPVRQISLNGTWEIEKTDTLAQLPSAFESIVPVPGLVDMAVPALDTSRSYGQGTYWYKTGFTIAGAYPDRVQLKIGKVKYHARIYLNQRLVGEQLYCFTPGTFNIREFLNPPGEVNELLIGVGCVNQLPDTVMWGWDFEKTTYIPGIYDNVELILGGIPFIENIQVAPLIGEEQVRIVARIDNDGESTPIRISYVIKELASGRVVAKGRTEQTDFEVPMPGCRLWTPETPFLYQLVLSTGADEKTVRFGMRSFAFDPETGRAMLNGKPYFMRGTNVCIYRFFEDPDRNGLPWEEQWAIKLHNRFREMNWNSIRYCIGFPPERWYEIADSLGFLIQDEYPVWTSYNQEKIYPHITAEHLANGYRAWMTERWNHPCVAIWDAQNESVTPIIGEAIGLVRGLDLSDRPWENGWSAPQSVDDPVESHPYLFTRYFSEKPSEKGALYDLLSIVRIPDNDANQHDPAKDGQRYPNPPLINEYGWLWLNRDGSTTTLTDQIYEVAFGPDLTREQRIYIYTRYLGMLTEYWRAQRNCAGVLHFCGLGYSRPQEPRGQTSDNFIDIENLEFEPSFVKYVKSAFSPVGIMINFWENSAQAGERKEIEIVAINDLESGWEGVLRLAVRNGEKEISAREARLNLEAYGRVTHLFEIEFPPEAGDYQLVAEIEVGGEPVKSIREFSIAGI